MKAPQALRDAFDSLAAHSLIIFGGKGGVGKTTISSLAALHFAATRETFLFSSDPASNLRDLFGETPVPGLTLEQLDAAALYARYLDENLESFLELGDRGTYLDKEELRRFVELALPGVDELMAWSRIVDLARQHPLVIVDSAPTGHALRMLQASGHFAGFGEALEAMQAKHRDLVQQLTRRRVRDALDEFIERFREDVRHRSEFLADSSRTAFVPVALSEPWVIEQTRRLTAEVRNAGIGVPLTILNRAVEGCDCARCRQRKARERGIDAVPAPRACVPLDSVERLREYLAGALPDEPAAASLPLDSVPLTIPRSVRLLFVAGKGGVGKTTTASSIALQQDGRRVTILSVDPAHGLRDALGATTLPDNVAVELIDTRGDWDRLRARLGDEIDKAVGALTGGGVRIAHDAGVMRQLVAIAPPGADELFAIMRLHDLLTDSDRELIVVDTAPTGHFLRLLELPETAGAWVREFMRILLRYRDLVPPGTLGEQLLRASRALHAFERLLRSEECACVVVLRPERIVAAETERLIAALGRHGIAIAGVVANALAPRNDCRCDRARRFHEEGVLRSLGRPMTLVEERDAPVTGAGDLRSLIPIGQTPA